MLLAVSRFLAARRPEGCGRLAARAKTPFPVMRGARRANLSQAVRLLQLGRSSRASFLALLSCMELKVPIKTFFQTFIPSEEPSTGRFPLFFQRLGRDVKRCCSITGLLLPSQMCSGRLSRNPFTVAAPFPFAAEPAGFPARLIIQTKEPAERRCPSDTFVSPPAEKVKWPEETRDTPALTTRPSHILLNGRISRPPALLPTVQNR